MMNFNNDHDAPINLESALDRNRGRYMPQSSRAFFPAVIAQNTPILKVR
jgi:hypothetical protein